MSSKKKLLMVCGAFVVAVIVLGLCLGLGLKGEKSDDPEEPLPPSPSHMGFYKKAAIAANGPPCAEVGKNALLKNGSAVDAAIAALFCEGIACPQSMGLGGGFIMTIYDRKNKKAWSLDARETAPGAATEDMFAGNSELAIYGGLSVAVPGELRGYWEAHKRFGRLPWRELITPSIELCRKGTPINSYIARLLRKKEDKIKETPSMSTIFINPATGRTWEDGDMIKRPELAKTLEIIAEEGGDALYNGSLVEKFVDDIKKLGGIITTEDMANYRAKWDEAVSAKLTKGNVTMFTGPPPGSGVLVTLGMNMLDGLLPAENDVISYQRIAETFKYMYGRRTELGDPAFTDMSELIKNLTSREYALDLRKQLFDDRTWQNPEHYGAIYSQTEDHGTAHISVMSPEGDAVSVTSTINLLLGAVVRSESTGIVLNDEMDDFSAPNSSNAYGIPPSPANFIRPGKRPISSMCPLIFVDNLTGDVRLVIGASGGSKITSAAMLVSIYNIWFNQTVKEAIDANRIHHQLFPMNLQYEHGILRKNVEGLKKIGHTMQKLQTAGTTVAAVAYDGDILTANSDYRRQAVIAGF